MMVREFYLKLLVHLEIGRFDEAKRKIVPYAKLRDSELILWVTCQQQISRLQKQRRWRMVDEMTAAKAIEFESRVGQAFREAMDNDVDHQDYANLELTKRAYKAWQEAFNELEAQYTLA